MSAVIGALRNLRCFLWDFDGCLCDSERLHFLAYARAFADFGHGLVESEYYPSFTHLGGGVEREMKRHGLKVDPLEIASRKERYYWELISTGRAELFPEVSAIVGTLRKAGKRVGIASNSSLSELSLILKGLGVYGDFDLVLGKLPTLRKKPEPDIFLAAMDKLGCSPSETLVFEDSDRGLQAAQNAGCSAVWIRTPYNSGLQVTSAHIAALTHAELHAAVKAAWEPDNVDG